MKEGSWRSGRGLSTKLGDAKKLSLSVPALYISPLSAFKYSFMRVLQTYSE